MLKELDREPTVEKPSKALDSLAQIKRPGNNVSLQRSSNVTSQAFILHEQHKILSLSWRKAKFHKTQGMPMFSVTLYKNRGGRSDCNNYTESWHLSRSIVGDLFAC